MSEPKHINDLNIGKETYTCEWCEKKHMNEFSLTCDDCDSKRENGDIEECEWCEEFYNDDTPCSCSQVTKKGGAS